jgi:predicted amidohydrolase
MISMRLNVATCQFPTSADPGRNLEHILRQFRIAKEHGADVAHFPEACLSGYVDHDLASYRGYDWRKLSDAAQQALQHAGELKIWVILGSAHRLTGANKPHNSLYIINDRGRLIDRYDKMFCTGDGSGKTGELVHYSPGSHFSVFSIKGIRCGAVICHEYRYPELYREYKRRGVQLMFHSFHAAHMKHKQMVAMQKEVGAQFYKFNRGKTLPEITMPSAMQAAAGSNHVWISCSNSSARESCWASFFVRPDGVITGRLRRNTPGVLISRVDDRETFYDSTATWRGRAMRGIYHSGTLVRDRRSTERRQL